MIENYIAVRGAVTVKNNAAEEIKSATAALVAEMLRSNNITKSDIASVYFTLTGDITKYSPAAAVREAGLVPPYAALFCMREPDIEGGLPFCIRVLINAESSVLQRFVSHTYQGGAKVLRPDLAVPPLKIAIDGPSGAGKTTVAGLIAAKMNIIYLDTGAIYRTIAVAAAARNISTSDEKRVVEMLPALNIDIKFENKKQYMFLDGVNVSEKIREHSISRAASDISQILAVRSYVTAICQKIGAGTGIVMEGRDICGYVLPDADVKIYLDAAPEIRAQRRFQELQAKGQTKQYEEILRDVLSRDANDMNRDHAPLAVTPGAVHIDASEMNIDEVFEIIAGLVL